MQAKTPLATCAFVFLLSLFILAAITLALGPSAKYPPGSDSDQYMSIGKSLAAGRGYRDPVGPWPDRADYARMPVWPVIISLGIRLAPGATPEAVSRFSNAVCLSLAGALFCVVCMLLDINTKLSAVAGILISLSPSLIYFSVGGMSEVSFVMLISAGIAALLAGGRWILLAALFLGIASLVRANFILVPPLLLALAFLFRLGRMELFSRIRMRHVLCACVLAAAPPFLWAVRNALITGRFPVLSTIEGETFYGANNDVVANNLEDWGYWVMPNDIPGETPKLQLARQLGSDLALNDYYHRKGVDWVKQNLTSLPRLELGKFVRAFAPIPWKPRIESYVVFSCRFFLYLLWISFLPFWWRRINRTYVLFCLAMAITHLITTAVYYGLFRFTHCYIEILFIPCIAFGWQEFRNASINKLRTKQFTQFEKNLWS